MMENKEIIKALECCVKNDCSDCPYREFNGGCCCVTALMEDVFELHKNQQAEIERLTKECGNQSALWSKHYEDIFETAKETIESEAIKEFAERLNEKLAYYEDEYGLDYGFMIDTVAGDVFNLVKEMVGDDNAQ
jgi:CRISPR/Cas system-associated endonuclease/helicase Cas3